MKIPKKIIYPVLIVLVIVSCSIGYYFYSTNVLYFKTDNAKITSKMYTITPVTNGKVIEWNVDVGDVVKKDQVLGRQQVLPYITSPINGTIVKNDVVKVKAILRTYNKNTEAPSIKRLAIKKYGRNSLWKDSTIN